LFSFCGDIGFVHISLHPVEVLVDVLVNYLGRQIDPNIQNTLFILDVFETVKQVALSRRSDLVGAHEVILVPAAVRLAPFLSLCASSSVGEEVVEKLNAEGRDVFYVTEDTHVDVLATSDIQENAIDEEQESFHIEELAPTQAEIKKKLTQPFVLNSLSRFLFKFGFLNIFFLLLFGFHRLIIRINI
jgi:hypothetical protein